MTLAIRGNHLEVTPALQDYVEKKMGRIQSWFQEECKTTVTLAVEGKKHTHAVEVTVSVGGYVIRAEDRSEDIYASVDRILDKLERQIRKHASKLRRRLRQGEHKGVSADFPGVPAGAEEPFALERVKRVELKPTDRQEAILHMNLLDHDFHVFLNRDSGRTEVVYRRKNGTYGVITD